jgi:hypothetical protein
LSELHRAARVEDEAEPREKPAERLVPVRLGVPVGRR